MHYNFARIHQTLRVKPAMAAGISNHARNLKEIVNLIYYKMECFNCGKLLFKGDEICPKCGERIKKEDESILGPIVFVITAIFILILLLKSHF